MSNYINLEQTETKDVINKAANEASYETERNMLWFWNGERLEIIKYKKVVTSEEFTYKFWRKLNGMCDQKKCGWKRNLKNYIKRAGINIQVTENRIIRKSSLYLQHFETNDWGWERSSSYKFNITSKWLNYFTEVWAVHEKEANDI